MRLPDRRVGSWFQVVLAILWHGELTRRLRNQVPRALFASKRLLIDFALQRHERVQQCLRTWRATGYMHIHGDVTVDPLEHVVTLLEWSAGDRAGAHRNNLFRFGHLIVKPDDLRGHLLGHRPSHNHEVCLAGRRTENLGPGPGEVPARHRGRNHLDGAQARPKPSGQTEFFRPQL